MVSPSILKLWAEVENKGGKIKRRQSGRAWLKFGKRERASPGIRALEGRLRIQPAWGAGEGRAGAEGQTVRERGTAYTVIRALEGRLRNQPAWGAGEGRAGAEGQTV